MTDSLPEHGQPGSTYLAPFICMDESDAKQTAINQGRPIMVRIVKLNCVGKMYPDGHFEVSP